MIRALPIILIAALAGFPANAESEAKRFTTEHGTRVIVQADPNSHVVAICVFVRAGVADELRFPGIGSLVSRAIFGGNDNQTVEEVNRCIYGVGGSLETSWNPDYTLVTCVTTREMFEEAFYFICQALKTAKFEPVEVDRARAEAAADIARESADGFQIAYAALRERMYQESPYRLPFGGTAAGLRRLSPEPAREFFARRFTPANTVVAVVGNVSESRVRDAAERQLYDYNRRGAPDRSGPARAERPEESGRVVTAGKTKTAFILAGFAGPGLSDPDYPAFAVLTAIIGGGKSSRIWSTIRDAGGIGYVVGAQTPPLARESHLLAYVEYDPERGGKPLDSTAVEKLLLDTVTSVLTNPPTEKELQRATNYLIGTHALAHQRTRDRAFYLGWYEAMGLGYGFDSEFSQRLAAVTSDDVKRVARKYLRAPIVSVVEPHR